MYEFFKSRWLVVINFVVGIGFFVIIIGYKYVELWYNRKNGEGMIIRIIK